MLVKILIYSNNRKINLKMIYADKMAPFKPQAVA